MSEELVRVEQGQTLLAALAQTVRAEIKTPCGVHGADMKTMAEHLNLGLLPFATGLLQDSGRQCLFSLAQ